MRQNMSRRSECFYMNAYEHIPIVLIKFLQSAVFFRNRIEKSKSSHNKIHQYSELNSLKAFILLRF